MTPVAEMYNLQCFLCLFVLLLNSNLYDDGAINQNICAIAIICGQDILLHRVNCKHILFENCLPVPKSHFKTCNNLASFEHRPKTHLFSCLTSVIRQEHYLFLLTYLLLFSIHIHLFMSIIVT